MVSPIRRRLVPTILLLLVISCSLLVTDGYAQQPKYIRVAIIQDVESLRLKIHGFYEVIDSLSKEILCRGKNLNTTATAYKGGVLLGDIKSKTNKLFIKSLDPDAVIIDGRRFRGNIELIKKDNLHLLVINDINLEDYIKGVLYHESSHYWPQEALKAQAVASRTYAVYQMGENKLKDYDVSSDIYSQVYGGKTSERYRSNKAVDATGGIILAYKGKVFPTYFHATCGGHTEDASKLWNINIIPLKGVVCSFCKDSPHFSWHTVLSLNEIEKKLKESNFKINQIKDIQILGRNSSGRITDLKIISPKEEIKVSAKDFRNIIGPNIIRSANFTLEIAGRDAVLEGVGWGHGVGLCQWGAYFMAKQGYKYKEILKYYYPQSEISLNFNP